MAKSKTKTAIPPPANGVTVRMFCHGLGDCFLITIPQQGARDYSILIDCGIAMGTKGEVELMKQVVKAITALTKDPQTNRGTVDLLVVTHEHRDHVSGFIQAQEDLSEIDVKHVWFAWTEDRQDPLAKALRIKHAKEKAALARAVKAALATAPTARRELKALNGVLAFYSPIAAAGGKTVQVEQAMTNAGALIKSGQPECLWPGTVQSLPGAVEESLAHRVRTYVLGPPHDETVLRRIRPRSKNSEAYEKRRSHAALGMSWTWEAAMSAHEAMLGLCKPGEPDTDCERAMPFDDKWRKDLEKLKKEKASTFFQRHYLATQKERRIDSAWLWSGAQQLALYMESYTNNTSLVLAFELPKSKKVLLFVGDAQVGNWLSWHDREYKPGDGRTVKAADLLAKTVLYKVGHHGSHNATLREKGLELMSHPELVAMLPVEVEAVQRLGYGEMPLESLLQELGKRTNGRVLQLDKKWVNGQGPGRWTQGLIPARLSNERFQGGADNRPLYVEYTVLDQ
jgi:hypothetical protein